MWAVRRSLMALVLALGAAAKSFGFQGTWDYAAICEEAAAGLQPPSYLAESDPDYLYVEDLQRSLVVAEGVATPEVDVSDSEAVVRCAYLLQKIETQWCKEASTEQCSRVLVQARDAMFAVFAAKRPTVFEDPVRYPLFKRLAEQVERAAALEGKSVPPKIVWATLPATLLSARVLVNPDTGTPIVLMPREFFNFALLTSKALVVALDMSVELESGTDIFLHSAFADGSREGTEKLRDLLIATVQDGRPGDAAHYLTAKKHTAATSILMYGMEIFALGHELSHVLLNHEVDLDEGEADKTTFAIRNVEWEIAADELGHQLLVSAYDADAAANPRSLAPLAIAAPYAMLRVLNAITVLAGSRDGRASEELRSELDVRSQILKERAMKLYPASASMLEEIALVVEDAVRQARSDTSTTSDSE